MSGTVFAIHGVKNHVQLEFAQTVSTLEGRLPGFTLEPVFWGDLGARTAFLEHVVPSVDDETVRGSGGTDEAVSLLEVGLLSGAGGAATARSTPSQTGDREISIIAAAAAQGPDAVTATDWEQALESEWDALHRLSLIDDPDLLAAVGHALASEDPGPAEVSVRGPVDWARQRIRDIDRGISLAIGASAGRLNEALRTKMLPDVAAFAGDIVVYQGNRERIQERVLSTIRASGYGTQDHPARIICHSLGGVITLDLCTRAQDPLWLEAIVTFGSQWPLFHLVDPRPGVTSFEGTPIVLPDTVGRAWTNVWEPLDPLAFIASKVFRLSNGQSPRDRQAEYDRRSGLWTHSAYWSHPRLFEAVRNTFGS